MSGSGTHEDVSDRRVITPQARQNRTARVFITFRVPHNLKTKIAYFWRYFQIPGGSSDSAPSKRQRSGGRVTVSYLSQLASPCLPSGRSHQRTAVRCRPTYSEAPLAAGRSHRSGLPRWGRSKRHGLPWTQAVGVSTYPGHGEMKNNHQSTVESFAFVLLRF